MNNHLQVMFISYISISSHLIIKAIVKHVCRTLNIRIVHKDIDGAVHLYLEHNLDRLSTVNYFLFESTEDIKPRAVIFCTTVKQGSNNSWCSLLPDCYIYKPKCARVYRLRIIKLLEEKAYIFMSLLFYHLCTVTESVFIEIMSSLVMVSIN